MKTGDKIVCTRGFWSCIKSRYIFKQNKSYTIVGFRIANPIIMSEIGLYMLKEDEYNVYFKPINMSKEENNSVIESKNYEPFCKIGSEYKKACDEIDKKLFNEFVVKMKEKLNQKEESYDYVNPNHYKQSSKEVIEMMELIWGKEALILHCEMTEFKYRMRAGLKPEQSIERDLEKAKWYEIGRAHV